MKILIINGPNMNLLGMREPEIYGKGTYSELTTYLWKEMQKREITGIFFQSNHEGALVDKIHRARGRIDGIVINPDSFAYTSIALHDAIKSVSIPTVQVLFEKSCRVDPKRSSFLTPVCLKTIEGEGAGGYLQAIDLLKEHCDK